MTKMFSNNLFATLLLAAVVFSDVKSLPTSVLVDSKQQSDAAIGANNKEKDTSVTSNSPSATSMETTPNNVNKDHQNMHAQKRGVKQNFYDRDLSNDILVNNNIPNGGIWDDNDMSVFYPDLHEMEDYQPYQQFPVAPPYQPKPYDNLQQTLNYDNVYDEPMALPVKYQYPRYMPDERRKRTAANKNLFRLKRESAKMSTADMLTLLALLEADERNTNRPINENDDANLALYYRMMHGNTDPMQDEPNDGEWWNDLIEPSVQYYGNPYGHIEQNARDRHQFPTKRFMISKKKRSLGIHKPDHFFDGPLKSKISSGFDSRYSASQRF